jgi:hypothetical protein
MITPSLVVGGCVRFSGRIVDLLVSTLTALDMAA